MYSRNRVITCMFISMCSILLDFLSHSLFPNLDPRELACSVAGRETYLIALGEVAWALETDGGFEFEGVDPIVDSGSADGVLSHFVMSNLLNFSS